MFRRHRRAGPQEVRRGGLAAAAHRKKPQGRQYRKLDGAREARLVALACSEPPKGEARWTLKLLADKLIELEATGAISDEAVRRVLKKMNSSRGLSSSGSSPAKQSAEFVRALEEVLDVYALPYDETRPVVCADEGGKQLIGEIREPLPPRPGSSAKQDYEYARDGTANVFMAFEPDIAKAYLRRINFCYTPETRELAEHRGV